jgi:hypothetical protein
LKGTVAKERIKIQADLGVMIAGTNSREVTSPRGSKEGRSQTSEEMMGQIREGSNVLLNRETSKDNPKGRRAKEANNDLRSKDRQGPLILNRVSQGSLSSRDRARDLNSVRANTNRDRERNNLVPINSPGRGSLPAETSSQGRDSKDRVSQGRVSKTNHRKVISSARVTSSRGREVSNSPIINGRSRASLREEISLQGRASQDNKDLRRKGRHNKARLHQRKDNHNAPSRLSTL